MSGPQIPDADAPYASEPARVSASQRGPANSLFTCVRTRSRFSGFSANFRGRGVPTNIERRQSFIDDPSSLIRQRPRPREPARVSADQPFSSPYSAANVRITIIRPMAASQRREDPPCLGLAVCEADLAQTCTCPRIPRRLTPACARNVPAKKQRGVPRTNKRERSHGARLRETTGRPPRHEPRRVKARHVPFVPRCLCAFVPSLL